MLSTVSASFTSTQGRSGSVTPRSVSRSFASICRNPVFPREYFICSRTVGADRSLLCRASAEGSSEREEPQKAPQSVSRVSEIGGSASIKVC